MLIVLWYWVKYREFKYESNSISNSIYRASWSDAAQQKHWLIRVVGISAHLTSTKTAVVVRRLLWASSLVALWCKKLNPRSPCQSSWAQDPAWTTSIPMITATKWAILSSMTSEVSRWASWTRERGKAKTLLPRSRHSITGWYRIFSTILYITKPFENRKNLI